MKLLLIGLILALTALTGACTTTNKSQANMMLMTTQHLIDTGRVDVKYQGELDSAKQLMELAEDYQVAGKEILAAYSWESALKVLLDLDKKIQNEKNLDK